MALEDLPEASADAKTQLHEGQQLTGIFVVPAATAASSPSGAGLDTATVGATAEAGQKPPHPWATDAP